MITPNHAMGNAAIKATTSLQRIMEVTVYMSSVIIINKNNIEPIATKKAVFVLRCMSINEV